MSDAGKATLRIAAPTGLRLGFAWLLAGPLNPVQIAWLSIFKLAGDEQVAGLAWVLGLCSAIGVAFAYFFAQGRSEFSTISVFVLAIKSWLCISGILILFACGLTASVILITLALGLGLALIAGLPAAFVAAFICRIVIFRRSETLPTPPQSATP